MPWGGAAAHPGGMHMRCRKNLRKLFVEFNAASVTEKPNTMLMKVKNALLALKDPATHPSLLIGRADVQANIANDVAIGELPPGATLASRYDDFVWAHHQVMMLGPNGDFGPNYAHRGPAFGPWHRELLKHFEAELRAAVGDPELCLPYWDWTKDRSAANTGFPFTTDFLGGDGAGPGADDEVTVGDFTLADGWILNCDEEGFGFLRREFGEDGPGLPTAQQVKNCINNATLYDSAPWGVNSAAATSLRNYLEGWVGAGDLHNAVHRWVGGSMHPGTSPNDPIFFLHHCNVDRIWSVWQQKHPSAGYLPDNTTPAASGLTRLDDLMSTFGRTATDRYFGVDVAPADVLNGKAITWYDTDLPELLNETGLTLSFVDIPEGLTSFKAVKFRVTGGRPVRFRITGLPAAPFDQTPMGLEFEANPVEADDFYYGYVWIQLTAPAGMVAPGSFDIHAYIVDEEGYYAATDNGEYPLGDFSVTVTATTVPRENNSVVLVLDRSGSMAAPAGDSSTKASLLRTAVSVFNGLMMPDDEIALVSFDDLIETPAPMQAVSANSVQPVLDGTDLEPRGLTCVGGGILQGAVELDSASHTNRSMIVLTDGIQNVPPDVEDLPAGTITNRTYAIGFGLPQEFDAAVLQQITANTHGDLVITGNISTDEQEFNLTKYFVQVLAGVSRMDVLLDPQGILHPGKPHVIPFQVTDADVYLDVIALCPIPQLLDFKLISPSGAEVTPATGGNFDYFEKPHVAFYRAALPVLPADPNGSHAGEWKAVLALKDREQLAKLMSDREVAAQIQTGIIRGGLPYSLIAHSYSNLRFDARLHQDSFKPGAAATIEAWLRAYDVPFAGQASVWADVTAPDGDNLTLKLDRTGDGRFSAGFPMAAPGVYACRVRAEGYFKSKDKFTREKTLTAGVFRGEPHSGANDDGPVGGADDVAGKGFWAWLCRIWVKFLEYCGRRPRKGHAVKAQRKVAVKLAERSSALLDVAKSREVERPVVRAMPKEYPKFAFPRVMRGMFARDADGNPGGHSHHREPIHDPDCTDPNCADPTHDHGGHDHGGHDHGGHDHGGHDPGGHDPGGGAGHKDHVHDADCADPDCPETEEHKHDPGHAHDAGHSHDADHSHDGEDPAKPAGGGKSEGFPRKVRRFNPPDEGGKD